MADIANAYSYDFVPEPELEDGDDYLLRLSQGMIEDFSPVFAVYDGRKAATTASPSLFAAESSTFVTSTRSTAATTGATTTSFVAEIPSAAAKSTISSSDTVEILVPIPTSSFDAPREEDSHLTSNDKFALGFGIPITLIILSTLGYWRATKYFLHHKVTGGLKLPVYGPVDYARAASKPDFRGRWISQPASLWGAASRPGSVAPSTDAFSDSTELTTAPNITRINADAKLSQGSLHAPSTLQQEWRVL
ncbi:Dual specificity protein kinase [Venturia inaequalis]|nr:Dual specificity protein kinase [Venturia inaequalis]